MIFTTSILSHFVCSIIFICFYIYLMIPRFLIPQSQKATDIVTKQILDFIERNES